MQSRMEEYFKSRPEMCVLFILENVEYYIENSKQSLLYKILDMLQYTKIKFAFIATSQKIDVIDNFEKRIKSRFSHRQILFYSEDLQTFKECIDETIKTIVECKDTSHIGAEFLQEIHRFITEEEFGCMKIFEKLFEKGKDYEFLCRTLKIALSHFNSTYSSIDNIKSSTMKISTFKADGGEFFRKSLNYVENLSASNDFKTILSKMPEAYYVVLLSGKNALANCKMDYFTFAQAYKEYKCFSKRESSTQMISKETFIKIFIDLICKGFFKSKSTSDYISVNNKLVMGVDEIDISASNLSTKLKAFSDNRVA